MREITIQPGKWYRVRIPGDASDLHRDVTVVGVPSMSVPRTMPLAETEAENGNLYPADAFNLDAREATYEVSTFWIVGGPYDTQADAESFLAMSA